MNAKSGNHFCDKIILKPLILRAFRGEIGDEE